MINNKFFILTGLIGFCLFMLSCPLPFTENRVHQAMDSKIPAIKIYEPAQGKLCGDIIKVRGSVDDSIIDSNNSVFYEVTGFIPKKNVSINKDNTFEFYLITKNLQTIFTVMITAIDWNENSNTLYLHLKRDNDNGIPSFRAQSGNNKVILEWDPVPLSVKYSIDHSIDKKPNPLEYIFDVKSCPLPLIDGKINLVIEELVNCSLYTFTLKATVQLQPGEIIESNSCLVKTIPFSAHNFTPEVTADYKKIKIMWDSIQDITEYMILRSNDLEENYFTIKKVEKELFYIDEPVSLNTIYYYKVQPLLEENEINIKSYANNGVPYIFPEKPYEISFFNTSDHARDVFVAGDHAYIANGRYGIKIVNIKDPDNLFEIPLPPVIKNNIYAESVYADNEYVYIAGHGNKNTGEHGLKKIDISFPEKPVEVETDASYIPEYGYGMHANEDYIFVADYYNGILIINKKDPAFIYNFPKDRKNTDIQAYDVIVSGDYAYIANGNYGLKIIKINNPDEITEVAFDENKFNNSIINSAKSIYKTGNIIYLVDPYLCKLFIIDIVDSENPDPEFKKTIKIEDAFDIHISANYAYVAARNALHTINISDPINPVYNINNSYKSPTNIISQSIFVKEPYAYIAADNSGLRIINILKPRASLVSKLPGSVVKPHIDLNNAVDIDVSGPYASVVDGSCVKIINISNPNNLKDDGFLINRTDITGIHISGPYIYTISNSGLRIYDISGQKIFDPDFPEDKVNDIFAGKDIYVYGSYAYTINFLYKNLLKIIDISNPGHPIEAGWLNLDNAEKVFVEGSYAYIAAGTSGIKIIDVSDHKYPNEIKCITKEDWRFIENIYVLNNYAYIIDKSTILRIILRIIDISDPQNPREVGKFENLKCAKGLFVVGSHAYVADGEYGIKIIDISNPEVPNEIACLDDDTGCAENVFVSGHYAYIANGTGGLQIIDLRPDYLINAAE